MPFFALVAALLAQAPPAPRPAALPSYATVVLETTLGTIEIEVDRANAPVTAANFLKYVDGKFYDGGIINRSVRKDNTVRHDVEIEVIQFQSDPERRREMFPAIPMERTSVTGLTHVNGALSMARSTSPDSATSSFSIMIGDQHSMDFGGARNADGQGFAAFGRVVSGMDVVRKIQAAAVRPGTQNLEPPIGIVRARRK